ncbi:MAG: cytochrome ubiquinol oxidase subunit I [Muribaculaceae bacterium]|nr:cytochrome ubiquinol oxidase subunit I [Muribaculaceae bacterium]
MQDLITVVDWSRWQFALTAMYHWLFVPLTLGLGVIVAIMETIYYRTRSQKWLDTTKFWMTLFGINFAMGVATGIILEFEFGTNWSNYSWFVGDIFGAPLAIEGLLAFFMEATFIAIMFFGWKKVSAGFHLASTWLTAIGASISALWILVANAWMQYPVGMEFDPAQMRNVMDNFWDVALSPVAIHKFLHAVFDGWVLAGVFVCGVSAWLLMRGRRRDMAMDSVRIGSWVGLAGMILTLWTGHSSAVDVARVQPMKLAAMEGLYNGHHGEELVAVGILDHSRERTDPSDPFLFKIAIPYGLSILADSDPHSFVPGINDIIEGRSFTPEGTPVNTVSYAERMERGRLSHEALRSFDTAMTQGDAQGMEEARGKIAENYPYFGYGYLDSAEQAVPPVGVTFYSFHIMVLAGGYLTLFLIVALWSAYKRHTLWHARWWQALAMLSVAVVWICSQAGWVTAEVGRQPWIIQDLMPTRAAISDIPVGSVMLTFWIFAAVFTALLVAEMTIMVKQINKEED